MFVYAQVVAVPFFVSLLVASGHGFQMQRES
jgi:hypothetical protein